MRSRPKLPGGKPQTSPLNRHLSPPGGPNEGDAPPKLGSESKLRVGSCVVALRLRVVCPPACLLSATASVETDTPPDLQFQIRLLQRRCQGPARLCSAFSRLA